MKTKFVKNSNIYKDFKKDLLTLIESVKLHFDSYVNFFLTLNKPISYPTMIKEFTSSTNESFSLACDSIYAVNFILDQLSTNRDTIEDFLFDIKEMNVIKSEEDFELFNKFFIELHPALVRYIKISKIAFATNSTLPGLKATEMSVSIRPIFDKDFSYSEDDITTYIPSPNLLIPVVQIQLWLSENNDNFSFQLNGVQFDQYITELLALQSQFKETSKLVDNINNSLLIKEEN